MTTEIRLAGPHDATAIAALRRTWTEEQAARPIHDESFEVRFEAWMAREREQRLTWLALADAPDSGDCGGLEPVGMLNLLVFTRMPFPRDADHDRPGQWGYLANAFVRPEHRNAGIGAALLATCVSYADAHGFARVVLSPSQRSVDFYARAGFAPATSLMLRPLGARS